MNYPLVSVIILNYNGLRNLGGILEECVKSVLNTDYPNFVLSVAAVGARKKHSFIN